MCCGGKICMFCTCVILLVVAIGFLFGFGVFKDWFHKAKDTLHDHQSIGRPFLGHGFNAPPPF